MTTKEETRQRGQKSESEEKIDLNILLKFIKNFDGNRENLSAFLTNCQNAYNLANPQQKPILFKYILSQLEGKAESVCAIREFESWEQLSEFLRAQFGDKKHYAALLSDLQSCKQNHNEPVNQYALRVESCLARLLTEINISLPSRNKGELAGRVAAMQDLALYTFITGLDPKLSIGVRCRDPDTLNEAINLAVSEEKILQTTVKKFPSFSSGFSFRNPPILSRNPQQTQFQFRPKINTAQSNNLTPGTSGRLFCRYCKKDGHILENCRRREYNNKRFQNQPQNYQQWPQTNQNRVNFTDNVFIHGNSSEPQIVESRDEVDQSNALN